MRTDLSLIAAVLFTVLSAFTAPSFADPAGDWDGPILKDLGSQHGIEVGAMGSVNPWNAATQMSESGEFSDPDYIGFSELHFDWITSGQNFLNFNVWSKPSNIDDPSSYVYLPDGQQFITAAANFSLHGAHMIWHGSLAPWMSTAQGFVAPDVESFMNHHIDNLAQLYTTVDRWVVVNEAVKDAPISTTSHVPGNLRDTIWKQEIGDDFIFKAFTRATQAGIGTRLYNDYGIYDPNAPKTQAVLQLVAALKAMNLIDGIGMQMHFPGFVSPPTVESFMTNFEQFAAVGVDVYITEFDITNCSTETCRTGTAPQVAFNIAMACRLVAACKGFAFWGLKNDLSWLHPDRVAAELAGSSSLYPLPFDENYAATPVFDAIVEAWQVSAAVPLLSITTQGLLFVALLGCGLFAVSGTPIFVTGNR
jgi:endo-1,4-beta-xylanase